MSKYLHIETDELPHHSKVRELLRVSICRYDSDRQKDISLTRGCLGSDEFPKTEKSAEVIVDEGATVVAVLTERADWQLTRE